MIQASKAVCSVTLTDPRRAFPGVGHVSQGRVAPSFWSKTMGVFTEYPIERGIQKHPHDLRQQCVAPDRDAEWSLFPVFLGNMGSPGWLPVIPFLLDCLNDGVERFKCGPICRFLRDAGRHRSRIAGDATVGRHVQMWVGKVSRDARSWQALRASLTEKPEEYVGWGAVALCRCLE